MTLPPTEGTRLPATTRPSTARRARGQTIERPKRPWPVTANALLLLVQAAGCLLMAALLLGPLGLAWTLTSEVWNAQRAAVVTGFIFGMLALLAMAAAAGFMRVSHGAWLLAVLVQGITLGLALGLYFEARPPYVYVMMVYGILMVLYLHQDDVQAAFRLPTPPNSETGPTG